MNELTRVKDQADEILSSLSERPKPQQIVIGASSGFIGGYIFAKIGKSSALIIGSTLILIQFATASGHINVDWKKIKDAINTSNNPLSLLSRRLHPLYDRINSTNSTVYSSFVGGMLVGFSFS